MARRPFALAALLVLLAAAGLTLRPERPDVATGAEVSPPTVHAVGLMINTPVGPEDGDFPELAFFGTFDRTSLACKLDLPGGGIVELRREDCTLSLFGDDRGTDLIDPEDVFGPFDMNSRVAQDGRSVVFILGTERLPDRAASHLRAEGVAALWVAEERAIATGTAIELTQGSRTTVGPYSFQVESAGASEWSEDWSLTLKTEQDPSAIVSWALVDEAGARIELRRGMSMSGMGSWQLTLEAEQAPARAALRVEHWVDPQIVRVPFELQVGLGLGR